MPLFLAVIIGFLAVGVGAVLAVPVPEAGVPLVLLGLRLLGRKYEWARRANRWVDARWAALHAWFRRQKVVTRYLIVLVLAAVLAALVWLVASHV